jgi:aryl-alcohol dehydrogenase-like predicted oxidoreductase
LSKICLGTAKIGITDYGYSKNDNSINVQDFLYHAINTGVNCIDTSPRYGNSETIIGDTIKLLQTKPQISTKIDRLVPRSKNNPALMLNSVSSSLNRLNVKCIDVCYLHQNEIDIISDKYIHQGIFILKDKHLIKKIGTSVYSEEELKYTLDSGIYDWVQIPINILDTSFYNMIGDNKIKVAARSVFLQGILLDKKSIMSNISNNTDMIDLLETVEDLCKHYSISVQELSIAYLSSLNKIDKIIIGTTSIRNIKNNLKYINYKINHNLFDSVSEISRTPKSWTNPRLW